jgi:hypothetical protein
MEVRMIRTVYRFEFTEGPDMKDVEETLLLSILAVGCLHGESAIRLDVGYAIDPERRVAAIDGTTPSGSAVARVFTGLSIHEFGDENFSIARVDAPLPASPAAASAQPEEELAGVS